MKKGLLVNNETSPNHLGAKAGAWSLLEIALLAAAIAGLLHFGYFQLAPWIWSQNLAIDISDVPVWYLEEVQERDGIEMYALYVLMFIDLFLVWLLSYEWNKLAGKLARYLFVLPFLLACAFVISTGFHPPMSTFANRAMSDIFEHFFAVMIVVLPVIALLYYLQQRSIYWVVGVVSILLIPVCFISTAPIEWYDYSYMLAPALRLFHGAGISENYFQYDLFLSLIGLAWMKLQLDMNSIQISAQFAFYLLFLGIFIFSQRWFLDKRLPVFLLVALVLVRIYSGPGEAVHSFQVTPLRLDLWLILLLAVYFHGPYHWGSGVFCGLMLVLHKNFGIIYSAAYIQLLLTLFVMNAEIIPGKLIGTASSMLRVFFKDNYRNLTIIFAGALTHYLIFRNPNEPDDYKYVQIGFDFIRITTHSFYWYVLAALGMSAVLLVRLRSMVSRNYLAAGFCLIYLVIGNSLYFFGRSHENNIINISAILLLLLFLLIDMSNYYLVKANAQSSKSLIHQYAAVFVSLAVITSIAIWYGDSITDKTSIQVHNVGKGQFIYPSEVSERYILNTIAEVRSVTDGNPKVYFVGDNDFLFDYYGGYVPVGYYTPVYAWISKLEFNKFLQGLVGQGYYLVVDEGIANEVLSSVQAANYRHIAGKVVAWK
jgi:hypothetical protein